MHIHVQRSLPIPGLLFFIHGGSLQDRRHSQYTYPHLNIIAKSWLVIGEHRGNNVDYYQTIARSLSIHVFFFVKILKHGRSLLDHFHFIVNKDHCLMMIFPCQTLQNHG